MSDDTLRVSVPKWFRIPKDMVRVTIGQDVEYVVPRTSALAQLIEREMRELPHNPTLLSTIESELEYLPQDRLLWGIIQTLLLHWFEERADRVVTIIRKLYLCRKKLRENRRGHITFHWKDESVQPPEITIIPFDGEDDGSGDTLGSIQALPPPEFISEPSIMPSISLPALPRASRRRT